VRGSVISHVRRKPIRAEITAARRAAHRLAASGRATILRFKPAEFADKPDRGCRSIRIPTSYRLAHWRTEPWVCRIRVNGSRG